MVSYKIGVCKVSAKGKDCSTVFKRLGYNPKSNTSVVLCKPKTGRMHQIRVHLQYLGKKVALQLSYHHFFFNYLTRQALYHIYKYNANVNVWKIKLSFLVFTLLFFHMLSKFKPFLNYHKYFKIKVGKMDPGILKF